MVKNRPGRTVQEIKSDALELVRNRVLLCPKEHANIIATLLYFRDDTDTIALLSQILTIRYLARAVIAERKSR
jgi:hypothetical protein